jgi:hypothetical protein
MDQSSRFPLLTSRSGAAELGIPYRRQPHGPLHPRRAGRSACAMWVTLLAPPRWRLEGEEQRIPLPLLPLRLAEAGG